MKLATIALASAFVFTSTLAFAYTVRKDRTYRTQKTGSMVKPTTLRPNYGNPNGNPDGPTTLSGTGSSSFGGSSPGTSGRN
jgi:hypothetical protein